MPLYQRIQPVDNLELILWKIEGNEPDIFPLSELSGPDRDKLQTLHHPKKIAEFLALRLCLKEFFKELPEITYSENGKPFLNNGYQTSFSHTNGYAGVILSKDLRVGLDVEVAHERIIRIVPKFLRKDEKAATIGASQLEKCLFYWGAKECMVKIEGNKKLDFRRQLHVHAFDYPYQLQTSGLIISGKEKKTVQLHFKQIEDLFITYGWLV